MSAIASRVAQLQKLTSPQNVIHRGKVFPFRLSNTLHPGASQIDAALARSLDVGLVEFWGLSEEAELFKDVDYGQWGLRLLPQPAILKPSYYDDISPHLMPFDVVIGEFYGDTDLLVMDTSLRRGGECRIIIAGGVETRGEWRIIASSFSQFLSRYVQSFGDKYWELNVQ